ncbi:replication-relaxation family protein [Amycolatopsis sp. CA-126428]|uniref:replication-relaxation family protein n=1 Tax=Amycolatopsis sp. CA-126428 TaxID=2073158 RepID=UPI000CD225EE|nr:replication-relaxation family protein [Amycolatopsis sp. CA-126428]
MTRTRVTTTALRDLAGQLPDRYVAALRHLAAVRVLTGAQLDTLLTEPAATTAATVRRVRRRIMTRLAGAGLVAMLPRRVGGVRAGSVGHVYAITHTGRRFLAIADDAPEPPRARYFQQPTTPYLAHALTVSGLYVTLTTISRAGSFGLARFDAEPACWWPIGGGRTLRPDAYLVLDTPTHAECWWIEVDQATETVPRLRAKLRTYLTHAAGGGSGPDGVFPRVLITAPSRQRADVIGSVISGLRRDTALLAVAEQQHAADFLINELHTT